MSLLENWWIRTPWRPPPPLGSQWEPPWRRVFTLCQNHELGDNTGIGLPQNLNWIVRPGDVLQSWWFTSHRDLPRYRPLMWWLARWRACCQALYLTLLLFTSPVVSTRESVVVVSSRGVDMDARSCLLHSGAPLVLIRSRACFRGRVNYTDMYEMLRNMEPPVGFGRKCPYRLAYRVSGRASFWAFYTSACALFKTTPSPANKPMP